MKYFIFTILMFLTFSDSSCFQTKTPEEVEEVISKSDSLKRVNKLCLKMPKPDDFRFVEKHLGGNSITAAISFRYLSRKEPPEIREFYNKWASENGWQSLEANQFTKGNQTIVIEFQSLGNANNRVK